MSARSGRADFGNFQDAEGKQKEKAERLRFGRFFYRFPNGESGADVYDRMTIFEDHLIRRACLLFYGMIEPTYRGSGCCANGVKRHCVQGAAVHAKHGVVHSSLMRCARRKLQVHANRHACEPSRLPLLLASLFSA